MKIDTTANKDIMCISALVYGRSKVGKTRMISTCEAPFILNVENSLVSLMGYNIPVVNVKSVKDFTEAMTFLTRSAEAKQYKTICLDSVSELAELILSEEKSKTKDARMAYGNMQEEIFKVIRAITALPFDCYVIAKAEGKAASSGEVFSPYIPSAKAAMRLPYLFDETFAMRKMIAEGEQKPKEWLQCNEDNQWEAGDKSGKLDMWEEPNIKNIFDKIRGKSIDEVRDVLAARQEKTSPPKNSVQKTTAKSKADWTTEQNNFLVEAKAIYRKAKAINDAGRPDDAVMNILQKEWYALCNKYLLADDNFFVPIDCAEGMHAILGLEKPCAIKGGYIDYGSENIVFFSDLLAVIKPSTENAPSAIGDVSESVQTETDVNKEQIEC